MPVAMLKKIRDECGVPFSELEDRWKELKKAAEEKGFKEGDDRFYQYCVGVLKKTLKPECLKKLGWKTSEALEVLNLLRSVVRVREGS